MTTSMRGHYPRVSRAGATVLLGALALLGGCAGGPGAGRFGTDGPEPNPPPDLIKVPDAEPKLEPIRIGGPNKPYDVLGHSYVPLTQDTPFTERGLASWYGRKFNGKRTSSGELYNMYGMTAAHPTLPIPSYARVRNPANGREVVVRINDRGPFHTSRIIDLSYTAALKLDLLKGVASVELQRITFEDIRTGAWRHGAGDTVVAAAAAPAGAGTAVQTQAATVPPAAPPAAPPPTPTTVAPLVDPAPAQDPAPLATASVPVANVASVAATPVDRDSPAPAIAATTLPPPAPEPASMQAPPASTEPIADAAPARAFTAPARGYWVQLGAFRAHDGAETFLRRVSAEMEWIRPLLAIFSDSSVYRLQAGPYASREQARDAAERVRTGLQLVPVIVERR